jgi:hypothetical protein
LDCEFRNEQKSYGLCTVGNIVIDNDGKCSDYQAVDPVLGRKKYDVDE